jgi:hypothetical protein
VYRNQHISLVVAGVGKANAAAATAFLYAANGCPIHAIWVNLGIAGHRRLPVGEAVLAHRIGDAASDRYWYPPLAIRPPCPTAEVTTLDRPDFDYAREGVFDMEASGFYATASRLSTGELVHCLKVISDNGVQPGHGIDGAAVYRLIGSQLDLLDELLGRVGTLANELHEVRVEDAIVRRYEQRWRCSETQRHQLRNLLTRWQTLQPGAELWASELERATDAKALLRSLRRHLDGLPVRL